MTTDAILLDDLLRISEAARVIGVSAATLRVWDRAGKLRAVRIAGFRYYQRREIEQAAVARLPPKPTAGTAPAETGDAARE